MRMKDRMKYLFRAPVLFWNILIQGRYDFTFDLMPMQMTDMPFSKRMNLLKAGLNLVYRRLKPYSMPLFMQIELTNYCNLKCPVCPTGAGVLKRRPQSIDPALFEQLMKEIGSNLLVLSLWAWGESLLHPELSEILQIIQTYDAKTLLSTNGQNLDDENIIQALIQNPPTYLIVALDGLTDETNSHFRVGAKLAPALMGVRRIAELKKKKGLTYPILEMRFMTLKQNQHEIPLLNDFAKENRFDMLAIRTLSIIDSPEEEHRKMVPDSENHRAYEYNVKSRLRRKDFICQFGFISPTVFADGTVVACEQDYNAQKPYGVFPKDGPFKDIWQGKRAGEIRRILRSRPETFSFCRNCPYADRHIKTCSIELTDFRAS